MKQIAYTWLKKYEAWYLTRHTFATMAKFKEVPVAAISEALGHADIKTTPINVRTCLYPF